MTKQHKNQTTVQLPSGDVRITHPDKAMDADLGVRKLDVVNYYIGASGRLLPQLIHRPVAFLRAPDGVTGEKFFQRHAGTLRVDELVELDTSLNPGHDPLLMIPSQRALIGTVQMNVIEYHTWGATTKDLDKPDRIVFDLDPGENLKWETMREVAAITRDYLQQMDLRCFLKTSGGKGLHIVVPLRPHDGWEVAKDFSKAVAQRLARDNPTIITATSGPENRVGKVFVDYIRNARGAMTVAAYSVRARKGMGVSMPCSWDELGDITGGAHWTIQTAPERIQNKRDPWADYASVNQHIGDRIKRV